MLTVHALDNPNGSAHLVIQSNMLERLIFKKFETSRFVPPVPDKNFVCVHIAVWTGSQIIQVIAKLGYT